ncbi:MAG: FAD-dependent monooxygenase [Promethearchaeota archaeon]
MDTNFEAFDVCIVGGSIAGNFLCYLLSDTNLNISVIEEHESIGLPFQCAGIVSQKLGNLINLPDKIISNRVKIAKIVAPKGKYIKLSGTESPYIINRVALDQIFYNKVKSKSNIFYFLGEKYKSFEYKKEKGRSFILIRTDKRIIKARMLIGCDGPLSRVGKQLNVKQKLLYATQIRINGHFNENEAVMYFNPRWKELFGWIVPEGKKIFRIGLATTTGLNINFKLFLKKLGIKYEHKIDQQGGLIPFGTMNKLAFDNILLLGDAAGQVKATTGGGIIMLLKAAKVASNCIRSCFKKNDFSKRFLKKSYEMLCKKAIGRELKIHFLIRLILMRFSNKDFETFFQVIKTHHIEKLITLYGDMDFPKKMVIKLIKNPFVLQFLFRFLVKNPLIVFTALKLLT